MESFTREVRERMYLWICYHKSSQVAGRRVVNGDPATIMLTAAVALKIDLPERRAGNVLRKFVGLLRCPEGAVRGGHKAVMVCEKDPVDLGGSSWEAAFRPTPEPPPDAGSAPVRVERGMGKYARSIYARLRKEASGAPSIATAAAMRFLIGGKMELAVERASQLLSAYQVFGVIAWQNGKDQTGGIRFLHNVEDWDDKDQSTVAQFLDRVEGGEKLEVKPKAEKVKPPALLVPPTPPSPPKTAPPRTPRATTSEMVAAGLRGRGCRSVEVKSAAQRLLANPLEVLPVLQEAAARGDSLTVQDPLVVFFHDSRSSCLSLAERIKVLDALAREKVIALSAGRKAATILPRKSSSPLPSEKIASPLDRWPDQRKWLIEILWNERSPTTGAIINPAALLCNADVVPTKDAAREVVNAWVQAGLLQDVTKEGSAQRRYLFPVDPTETIPPAGEDAGAAEAKVREAQKRRADLEAAQTELERVTAEIDRLYPRFQALLTKRDELTEKVRHLQAS